MRKRSKHRPRPLTVPINIRFGSEVERTLQLIPHSDLEKFRTGEAVEEDWHTVVARLNVGYVLADRHFNVESRDAVKKALDSMVAVMERHQRLKRWGTTGEEFTAIGLALNLCDEMQTQCTRRQLQEALIHVYQTAVL